VKFSKVAAVMAGSVMAVGIAAPAFADNADAAATANAVGSDLMTTPPTSITGGVNELTAQQPLQKIGDNAPVAPLLASVSQVGQVTEKLRGAAPVGELLGQGTGAVRDTATSSVLGAVPGASLLGGLPLGGLGGG